MEEARHIDSYLMRVDRCDIKDFVITEYPVTSGISDEASKCHR